MVCCAVVGKAQPMVTRHKRRAPGGLLGAVWRRELLCRLLLQGAPVRTARRDAAGRAGGGQAEVSEGLRRAVAGAVGEEELIQLPAQLHPRHRRLLRLALPRSRSLAQRKTVKGWMAVLVAARGARCADERESSRSQSRHRSQAHSSSAPPLPTLSLHLALVPPLPACASSSPALAFNPPRVDSRALTLRHLLFVRACSGDPGLGNAEQGGVCGHLGQTWATASSRTLLSSFFSASASASAALHTRFHKTHRP